MIWTYTDNTGVARRGVVERTIDRGGTDVTYYFRRLPDPDADTPNGRTVGTLDVLSGSYVARTGAHPEYQPSAVNIVRVSD